MSQDDKQVFVLPKKLESVLASLATYFRQHNKSTLQRILVNSRYRVEEGYTYDNWDGGTWGHAIYFQVPAPIYHEMMENLSDIAKEIKEGINRLMNVRSEYIEEVFLEIQDDPLLEDWRERSGVLIRPSTTVEVIRDDQLDRIWKRGYLRLFLSHLAKHKKEASQFKEAMNYYGVSCFVAHEDIEPTKEWQDEIERALFSMDALVAMLTEGFNDSRWTDQEVGVAIGRQVPIIPIRLGMDPYGFIGKYQGLPGTSKKAKVLAQEVYDLLGSKVGLEATLTESLVARFETSDDFYHANALMKYLERLKNVSPDVIERLEQAPGKNSQVAGAFDVKEKLPSLLRRLRGG